MKAKLQRQERPKELEEDTSQSTIGKRRRGVLEYHGMLFPAHPTASSLLPVAAR